MTQKGAKIHSCSIIAGWYCLLAFVQSETIKHITETQQVEMISEGLCEQSAREGICLVCILFGLDLPYGLINNAGQLNQQLQ